MIIILSIEYTSLIKLFEYKNVYITFLFLVKLRNGDALILRRSISIQPI
jgi:hypothetical protein